MNFLQRHKPDPDSIRPLTTPTPTPTPTSDGFMTAEQLERPNEVAIDGKSSLMYLAQNLTKSVEAAERQHAQSLQEVIDAQTNAMAKFTIAYDMAIDKLRTAADMAVQAQKDISDAVRILAEDSIDTSQMVSKLRDIRIKSPLRDKAKQITEQSNKPRKKRG